MSHPQGAIHRPGLDRKCWLSLQDLADWGGGSSSKQPFMQIAAKASKEPTLPLFDSAAKVCYRGERRR